MATKPTKPGLADWERLLTVNRLQTQAARSVALDGGALGVMAVAAIVLGIHSAHRLWIAALVVLVIALCLALRALRLPGAERNGPSVAKMLDARAGDED